jgi:hypothetical protein
MTFSSIVLFVCPRHDGRVFMNWGKVAAKYILMNKLLTDEMPSNDQHEIKAQPIGFPEVTHSTPWTYDSISNPFYGFGILLTAGTGILFFDFFT